MRRTIAKGVLVKMKRVVSAVLVCALLLCSVFALVACGGISGTYVVEEFGIELAKFKFSGSSVSILVNDKVAVEGTYELSEDDNGNQIISFDFNYDEDDGFVLELVSEIISGNALYEKGDGFIKINGVKMEKA